VDGFQRRAEVLLDRDACGCDLSGDFVRDAFSHDGASCDARATGIAGATRATGCGETVSRATAVCHSPFDMTQVRLRLAVRRAARVVPNIAAAPRVRCRAICAAQ
jgi:hypothetical protein